jgi:hypothetical protein
LQIPGLYDYDGPVGSTRQLDDLTTFLRKDLTVLYTSLQDDAEKALLKELGLLKLGKMLDKKVKKHDPYKDMSYALVTDIGSANQIAVMRKYLVRKLEHQQNCKCQECRYTYLRNKYKTKYLGLKRA